MLEILSGLATPANLIMGLIALMVTILVAYYQIVPARDRIRRDFLTLQPQVLIGNASVMSAGRSYSVRLRLHNLGKATAYDGTVTMDGWPGEGQAPIIHPLSPGHNEYEVPIELGWDSPIRTTLIQDARVKIRYRDRWNNWYDLSYPVLQTSRANGLFKIHIPLEQPTIGRPRVSVRKMRKYLRETPTP